jgi:hypothetical protein
MRKEAIARRGLLEARGKTMTEAKTKLNKMVDWAVSNTASHIEMRFGYVIVIYSDLNGYSYAMFYPSTMAHGQAVHSRAMYGIDKDYLDVLDDARGSACASAWIPEMDDEDHISKAQVREAKADHLRSLFKYYRDQAVKSA